MVSGPLVVAVTMLLGTGVVPTPAFPPDSLHWSMAVPSCPFTGERLPDFQHRFPLWSTVDVRWTATGDVWFEVAGVQPVVVVEQVGDGGNASFVSSAEPLTFFALNLLPPSGPSCPTYWVNTTVTYSI